jgi:hypothetical protein
MRFVLLNIILLFCLQPQGIIAQEKVFQNDQNETDPDQLEVVVEQEEKSAIPKNDVKPKRLQTHLEAGTSFSYSPGNYYGPSYYVAPGLSYLITPRFALSAGIAVERSDFYLVDPPPNSENMLPMTRAFLYARGTYMLSERLALSGTVYKTVNDVPRREGAYDYNYQGMMMGVDYKINSSFSIGFHVATRNGYYNPNSLIPPSGYVYVPGF